MALLPGQVSISLSNLYQVEQITVNNFEQNGSNIWVDSGSIDIYSSQSATEPTALSKMTLNAEDTAVSGFESFDGLPNYIAIVQNAGTSTEIILNGIKIVEDLGAIS